MICFIGDVHGREESITAEDVAKFDGVEGVDILVTHVPPMEVMPVLCHPVNRCTVGKTYVSVWSHAHE